MESQEVTPTASNPSDAVRKLKSSINKVILGQETLVSRLLIALLADGHLLVEGAPGLAKTKLVKALSEQIEVAFHRIQFTPDLLPADITGTDIYRPQEGTFTFQQGPIFHNLVLADEINRAPAKVQSALLEAMAENQVTVGSKTYSLPKLFLVMATQNAIEQEGTYPLPEAQLDRFQMMIKIDYPNSQTEKQILKLARMEQHEESTEPKEDNKVSQQTIFDARKSVTQVHVSNNIEEYIVALTMATRQIKQYDKALAPYIANGVSPRGTIALERCAKAHAWLDNRDYVSPGDVQAILPEVFRHRILTTFQAQAENITPETLIEKILNFVAIP